MLSVSGEQMRMVDETAIRAGLSVQQMMENAGRAVAVRARWEAGDGSYLVLAGKGNNGGDGLVAARFLKNWGFNVKVLLAEKDMSEINRQQLKVLEFSSVPVVNQFNQKLFDEADIIIDALLGYGLKGDPKGDYARLINAANESGKKVLAVDIPTGLDADSGKPYEPCIRAHLTVTLALPKKGLFAKGTKKYTGTLYVAEIGIPQEVYSALGIKAMDIFRWQDTVMAV